MALTTRRDGWSGSAAGGGPRILGAALALTVLAMLAGCGGQPEDSALVLRVGPPSDATTVEAAAGVVRARLAGLDVEGTVTTDGDLLRLDVPPARPASGLVGLLTDPRRLRILAIPEGASPGSSMVDPAWEPLIEASGPVPTDQETDQVGGPALTFTFVGSDAERLAAHTATHVAGQLAFVLGDEVLAVPVVQSPIEGGRLTLTLVGDDWSPERLRDVTAIVSSGPLPAPLVESLER